MALSKTLKRLLKSSPATAELGKYLTKLDDDIYNNSTSDAALAARVSTAEDKITTAEGKITTAEGKIQALEALHTQDIEFTITDGTDPVEGATVTINNKTGTSAATTGKCTIEGILEGTYDAAVTCDGYEDETSSVTVTSSTTSFTIALTAVTPADAET